MLRALFCGCAIALVAQAAVAQGVLRTLPEDAKRGTLTHVHDNLLSLDGKDVKLAASGQIRGDNNMIVMPAALPKSSDVLYVLDVDGNISRAWVLTKDEQTTADQKSGFRWPWTTSPEQGRPLNQVLPQAGTGTTAGTSPQK